MTRTFKVADLLCGAGGSSTGALRAIRALDGEMDLVAVNHWPTAIATHTRNHPTARHYVADVNNVDPEKVVPGGELDLLMASPECRFFSRARGGKPVHDQGRMSAWAVQRWLSALRVRTFLVENVPEFTAWGPLLDDGTPDSSRRGLYFQAWVESLWKMGASFEWRMLNAADFGDATTRTRFFGLGRFDGLPIRWPEPTHSASGTVDLFSSRPRWRAARDVIDLAHPGPSLLARKKSLSLNTRLRIARGLQLFGGLLAPLYVRLLDLPAPEEARFVGACQGPLSPFVLANRAHNVPRSVDDPIPALTTSGGGGIMLVAPTAQPFILGQHSGSVARSANEPLPTIATDGAISMTAPILTPYYGNGTPASVERPLPTVTTKARFGLCSPLVVPYGPRANARSVDAPLVTITTADRLAVCTPSLEPFLVPNFGEAPGQAPRVHSVADPLPAVTSRGAGQLVMPTIACQEIPEGVDPRRLVLLDGQLHLLDLRYRMLAPRELARAMGFDDTESEYEFVGNVGEVTRQIGNAVACNLAAALVGAILGDGAIVDGARPTGDEAAA